MSTIGAGRRFAWRLPSRDEPLRLVLLNAACTIVWGGLFLIALYVGAAT